MCVCEYPSTGQCKLAFINKHIRKRAEKKEVGKKKKKQAHIRGRDRQVRIAGFSARSLSAQLWRSQLYQKSGYDSRYFKHADHIAIPIVSLDR
jgi:hypothetical protein